MKKSRYNESQIISILKEAENGVPVADLCRKHGMSDASFYNWRAKYGGMDVSMMIRIAPPQAGQVSMPKTRFKCCAQVIEARRSFLVFRP